MPNDRARAPGSQRLGMVAELPAVLEELKVDSRAFFGEFGLDVTGISPQTRLPFPLLASLMSKAVEVTECEHIGLLCGLRFRLAHHGILGELMRRAPTLRIALQDYVTWQPRYSNSAIVYLHRSGADYAFGFGIYVADAINMRVINDCVVGVGCRMVRLLTGQQVYPVEILLGNRPPANKSVYARLLRTPVRFNQAQSCLILDNKALDFRLPDADPAEYRKVLATIREAGRWHGLGWTSRTRHELRRSLLQGRPQMNEVALALGINLRTFRRRLEAEETSFVVLRDEVRRNVAFELLEHTELPVAEISTALAFASPRVMADSFRRWTGKSPSDWRSEVRSGHIPDRA